MQPIAHFSRSVSPWPAHLLPYVPAPVRDASATLQKTIDNLDAAERDLLARRADAQAVQAADKAAARTAVGAGKAPPASGLPAAIDAVERAVRAVEARTDLAREAQGAFIAVQLAQLAQTTDSIRSRQGAIAATIDTTLTEVAAGLNELHALTHVLAELEGGVLAHKRTPSFKPVRGTPRRPRDLGAEAVEPVREQIAEHAPMNMIVTGAAA